MIINAGIEEIIYIEDYDDQLATQLLKESNLSMRQVSIPRIYGINGTNSKNP